MFVSGNVFICLLLLVLCEQSLSFVTDDLIVELYSKYISAVSNDNFTVSTRRLFKKNKEYEIHVKKLKEVNGYKRHNLLVKEKLRIGGRDTYIYINNPVESKIPKAYLTLEEFKNALIDRVLAQKKEFTFTQPKKGSTYSYNNILRHNIVKDTQQNKNTTEKERTLNISGIVNLKANTVTMKNNNIATKNLRKINKDFNKEKITIRAKSVSAENNKVHENVTNSKRNAENNVTSHLVMNITEAYKNVDTKITKSQDIIIDTTEPITNDTTTEATNSHSDTNFEESKLPTDNTTVIETTVKFRTKKTEFLTNTEIESLKIKDKPRRKKTTKSFSVSHKKRRSSLGRPLVFFGSR